MANLSDRNGKVKAVETPQSPGKAGEIKQYGGASAPSGYLECSGQAVSRTDYSQLFTNIGTKYGVGDGSTTFNLPNGPRRTVEVDIEIGGAATSTSLGKALYYQSTSGDHRLTFNCYINTAAAATITVSIPGVTFYNGQSQSVSVTLNTVSAISEGQTISNSDSLKLEAGSSRSTWRFSGDVSLASKPTDAFVGADSRFSTFDEALESIPVIKLYDDSTEGATVGVAEATVDTAGTVKLSSDFAANDGSYGLVQMWEETIVLTNSGTGSYSGTFLCRRVGNLVTITSTGTVTHNTGSNPGNSAVEIPEVFRPDSNIANAYYAGAGAYSQFQVNSAGSLNISHNSSRGNSIQAISITYGVS